MEEEFEYYIFSAEKLANFCKNELEAIASVQELNYKLGLIGIGCDKIDKEVFAKLKTTMPETVAVLRSGFFKEGQLEEITSRFRDALPQILEQIKPIAIHQAAFEPISIEDFMSTLPTPPKKPSTHNKYQKREFHRRFF